MKKEVDVELRKIMDESFKYDFPFCKGKLNFDTPLNIVLKELCNAKMDDLLVRKDIKVTELQKNCSILILKEYIYLTEVITDTLPEDKKKDMIIQKIEYSRIHEIELDSKGAASIALDLIKEMPPVNKNKLTLCFNNIDDTMITKHFIEKQKQLYWQILFENNTPLFEPDFYQAHFFLTKLNSRGGEDNRVILLTDKYIMNINYESVLDKKTYDIIKLKKPKWAIYIGAFTEMVISDKERKKKNYVLKISIDGKLNKSVITKTKYPFKSKSSTDFMFDDDESMDAFIFHVKRLYFLLNNKYIPLKEK